MSLQAFQNAHQIKRYGNFDSSMVENIYKEEPDVSTMKLWQNCAYNLRKY